MSGGKLQSAHGRLSTAAARNQGSPDNKPLPAGTATEVWGGEGLSVPAPNAEGPPAKPPIRRPLGSRDGGWSRVSEVAEESETNAAVFAYRTER